jgi:hypothetical protein
MGAAVLVYQHARQRRSLAPPAVLAAGFGPCHRARLLQAQLHPGVAALATVLTPVKAVEMLDVPARELAPVKIHQPDDLVDRGAPVRHLCQPLIDQPIHPLSLVAAHLAPKRALRDPQNRRRLRLRQPPNVPSLVRFLEPHDPGLL